MPLPQPNSTLTGACSVIYNNVLYAYSPEAFQSLTIEEGAKWKTLTNGESVQGGVCVGSTPGDAAQAGLFVVGGTSSNTDYKGLQKFTYSTGKWESIMPQVAVTQSRIWHSATYLNASNSILVYAGSQDGIKYISTQTFTIGAAAPYSVSAYESIAPPAIAPILLPWSATDAVMIGGDATNTKVMLFNPDKHWYDSGASLANPIVQDTNVVKGTLVVGDDGSKHLYTFDASTSPNTVNRTVLWDGSSAPVVGSVPIQGTGGATRRALDESDWPTYNATLAPDSTRSEFSLASDTSGTVIMSGGNDDDVLCMFDAMTNSWQNATALLVGQSVKSESVSDTTSSATPTATGTSTQAAAATQSATTTAAAAATSSSSSLPPTSVLGIALGVIFGCAIMLIALLFVLKRKRQKQAYVDAGHTRRSSGIPEKPEYMTQDFAQSTGPFFPGHAQQDSQSSFSSMAILMGKAQKPALNRKPSKDSRRSSASSILNRQFKSTIGRPSPIPEPEIESDTIPLGDEKARPANTVATQAKPRAPPIPEREDGLRRSSGWNRYWSGGSTLNMMGFGNAQPRRETQASEQSSHYSDMYRRTQDSATVPPLHVEERPSFSRVYSGSPTVSHFTNHLGEGQSVEIERPVSNVSSSGYSSGIPPSVHEQWDPSIANKPWGQDRAPSSAYSQSVFPTALGAPSTSRPLTGPNGASRQPQLTMASTSDMSWLNLGENGHDRQSK